MAIGLVKDSSAARDGSHNGLVGIVDESWRRARVPRPSEGTPKGGTHALAVCMTLGQLDDCVALRRSKRASSPLCVSVRVGVDFVITWFLSVFLVRRLDNFRRFRGLCLWDLSLIRPRGGPRGGSSISVNRTDAPYEL